MRRTISVFSLALLLGASLVGCAQKTDETVLSDTSTDSLLSTNPVEQPQGDLTPQEQYQSDPQTQSPPAPVATKPRTPAPSRPKPKPSSPPVVETPSGVTLASGTPIDVAVNTQISTKTAQVGDSWSGSVKENVIVGNTVVIPAGSIVSGVVNVAKPAAGKGTLATLGLAVRSISVGGRDHMVAASTEPIEAGSPRARNLGAIAGGAAAGALIGKAAGGGGKGALIGGLIGGVAAGAGVAASKGYQVELKEGTVITFSVDQSVLVKS